MIYYFSNNTVHHKEVTQLPNIKSSIRSVKTDAERRAKNSAAARKKSNLAAKVNAL